MFILFILATFVIQITFLNMLIAVMSDTFSRVKEKSKTTTTTHAGRVNSRTWLVGVSASHSTQLIGRKSFRVWERQLLSTR